MNRADKHDLEKNELAEKLGAGIGAIQPAIPLIIGVIALIIVGGVAYGLYTSNTNSQEAAAWTEYYFSLSGNDGLSGSDAETLISVADDYPDSSMSGWARLAAGDKYLQSGVEAMYSNRKQGIESLQKAVSTYEQSLNESKSDELKVKALLGLGRAHESLGELDKAGDYYQQFVSSSAPPQMIASVNERITFLNSEGGKAFYDWFSKLDPKPSAPINLPENMTLPPDSPNLNFGTDNLGTGLDLDLGNVGRGLDLGGDSTSGGDSAADSTSSESTGESGAEPIDPSNVPDLNATAPEGTVDNINDLELPPQDGGAGEGTAAESSGETSESAESSESESTGDDS
ncbi:MAG: tetratricopeptide repeat protein [Planctomycetota bacterium]